MNLADSLRAQGVKDRQPRGPLWQGPTVDGVTYSMLSRFLVCRERFRVAVIEGLRPTQGFNHRVEYGQMWHVCEESHAKRRGAGCPNCGQLGKCHCRPSEKAMAAGMGWEYDLRTHCANLCKQYPMEQAHVEKWYNVCRVQFPVYVDYWATHPDVVDRVPVVQEHVFDLPYILPSGRSVRLRGKFDSVDLIGQGKARGIYLQENKTKGDIDPLQLQRQLKFDLQTMLYLVALRLWQQHTEVGGEGPEEFDYPILGVRYNVVRRPLSGGKGTIVQKKGSKNVPPETAEEYYTRLAHYIITDPGEYFMRWKVDVAQKDMDTFVTTCLDPLLEQLCDWYEWVTAPGSPWSHKAMTIDNVAHPVTMPNAMHWRHPYGVFNVLDEGGSTDLDEYLDTGSEVGLRRVDKLFTELEPS